MIPQVAPRLFTTEEFHRMGAAGILTDEDRVELVDGEVVHMSPIGSLHQACVDRLTALLIDKLGRRAIIRVQGPVVFDRYSELQPDVAVLTPRPDFYAESHPGSADVILLVEVVDSTGRYDRSRKLPLYAKHGIAEVWLVDVKRSAIEVHRQPTAAGYTSKKPFGRGERLRCAAFPRLSFAVDEILG